MKIKGLSIHCHHNILMEYCYDFQGRVDSIKSDKPLSEQPIRLKLFKLLPQEAINDLPEKMVKAYAKLEKAYAKLVKAYTEWDKADAEWDKAYAELVEVYAEWDKADAERWHQKWCDCKQWNGKEIVF